MFPEDLEQKDWRDEIKREIGKLEYGGSIKELKDYTLIEGELYKRLPGGILSRCINEKEEKLKLEDLYSQVCGVIEKISLYRRMRHMGYYWLDISKEAATVQEKCQNCRLSVNKEESYVVFITEGWRTPFVGYLTQGILQAERKLAY